MTGHRHPSERLQSRVSYPFRNVLGPATCQRRAMLNATRLFARTTCFSTASRTSGSHTRSTSLQQKMTLICKLGNAAVYENGPVPKDSHQRPRLYGDLPYDDGTHQSDRRRSKTIRSGLLRLPDHRRSPSLRLPEVPTHLSRTSIHCPTLTDTDLESLQTLLTESAVGETEPPFTDSAPQGLTQISPGGSSMYSNASTSRLTPIRRSERPLQPQRPRPSGAARRRSRLRSKQR